MIFPAELKHDLFKKTLICCYFSHIGLIMFVFHQNMDLLEEAMMRSLAKFWEISSFTTHIGESQKK